MICKCSGKVSGKRTVGGKAVGFQVARVTGEEVQEVVDDTGIEAVRVERR